MKASARVLIKEEHIRFLSKSILDYIRSTDTFYRTADEWAHNL